MRQVYLISGLIVAGCSILALILTTVGMRHAPGELILGNICEIAFLGITASLALFYFANWFRNKNFLFIMAWVVAALAALTFIMVLVGSSWYTGTGLAGIIFMIIFLGIASTLILLRLSGKFNKG